ncbi:MAG: hypothetical protein DRQ02_06605 [Candidatus Latescibacterota bacterium]|nr:MAG: hypothetical protein DRQ02_06605 [Candidatus Latescibacterota bacterium]
MTHPDSLFGYFFYMSVALTFFPLPTPPVVVYMGEYHPAFLVALVGGIGSCLAGLIDYSIVSLLLRLKKLSRLQQSKVYKKYGNVFRKFAFWGMIITAFTPIPFDPIKLMAITARYDKVKYTSAIFLGRAPRYFILAKLGSMWHIPPLVLLLIIIVLFIPALWKSRGEIKVAFAAVGQNLRQRRVGKQEEN